MPTKIRELPDRETLLRVFDYDPSTGVLRWKVRAARCITVGDVVGCHERGGVRVRLFKTNWFAHRIIWKMIYGTEDFEIDHRDGDNKNNKIWNLRPATNTQNRWNSKCFQTRKWTSTHKGVWLTANRRWASKITCNGVPYYLGRFETEEDAQAAYWAKAQELHGEFARAG